MMDICLVLFVGGILALVIGIGGTILIPTPLGKYAIPAGLLAIIVAALLQILSLC